MSSSQITLIHVNSYDSEEHQRQFSDQAHYYILLQRDSQSSLYGSSALTDLWTFYWTSAITIPQHVTATLYQKIMDHWIIGFGVCLGDTPQIQSKCNGIYLSLQQHTEQLHCPMNPLYSLFSCISNFQNSLTLLYSLSSIAFL